MITQLAVHLTGSAEDDVRLAYAEPIARLFDAHLTGLQVHSLPESFAAVDPVAASILQDMQTESDARAARLTETLKAKFATYAIPHDVRRVEAYPGAIGNELAALARTSDLFVGTRPYGDPTGAAYVEEQVLFGSGRGCLFLPPGGTPPAAYDTILVAWKENRESARAVAEALPFLRQAKQVVVALVETGGASEQYRVESSADIGRYLSRHGVAVDVRKIGGWKDVGEALLNEAAQSGADMIVMGGYGHSRFREWVLGGTTRKILSEATVPVLMAH